MKISPFFRVSLAAGFAAALAWTAPAAAQTSLTLAQAQDLAVAHSFAVRSAVLDRSKAERDIQ